MLSPSKIQLLPFFVLVLYTIAYLLRTSSGIGAYLTSTSNGLEQINNNTSSNSTLSSMANNNLPALNSTKSESGHATHNMDKGFDFSSTLASQAHPMWNIISSSQGTYNHCGDTKNITWLLLSGHIRSMHDHITNVLSFLETSSDCWFVVVFTRNELTGDSIGFQQGKRMCDESNNCTAMKREYNVTKHLNEMQQHSFRSNFAYSVAERNEEPGGGEWHGNLFSPEWPGVTMAMQLVAESHGIRHSSADIVILSRPDIMLSHTIQTKNLHELAIKENVTFLVPHIAAKFGTGNDPSEVWVLMTWDLLVGMCSLEVSLAPCLKNKNASQCLSPICMADFTTSQSRCGHYYKRVLSAGTSFMNASTYYLRPELKFHFHRITGVYSKAVNAPGSKQINPQKSLANSPRLDLLKNVGCEYSPPNVCDKNAKKDSNILVHGNHKAKYTINRYDGAAYVCTERFDLQT